MLSLDRQANNINPNILNGVIRKLWTLTKRYYTLNMIRPFYCIKTSMFIQENNIHLHLSSIFKSLTYLDNTDLQKSFQHTCKLYEYWKIK